MKIARVSIALAVGAIVSAFAHPGVAFIAGYIVNEGLFLIFAPNKKEAQLGLYQ